MMSKTNLAARLAAFPSHIAIHHEETGAIVMVQPGQLGYWTMESTTLEQADAVLARLWGARAPTDAEREAAKRGSMFGWDVPGADPARHAKPSAEIDGEAK